MRNNLCAVYRMEHATLADRSTRTVRVAIPTHIHTRLRHLAVDRGLHLADVMQEAVLLVLRYHDCGGGLPLPDREAPAPGSEDTQP